MTKIERAEYAKRWRRAHPGYNTEIRRKKHPLYSTWANMKNRCLNPRSNRWSRYGGRGIEIYGPWIDDVQAFGDWVLENLGPRPEGCSLDRIDNDGNYEPGNLQWATRPEQARNREISTSRDLPPCVRKHGRSSFLITLAGFPNLESAKQAVEIAETIRDEAINSTSNREAA